MPFALARHDLALRNDPEVRFVRGDPNGLAYDAEADALYVADGRTGAVLCVDGDRSCRRLARIDSGGVLTTDRITGLALAPDGSLFVARLGYGRAGAILRVGATGDAQEIPNLAPEMWRIGLACDASGGLFVAQFSRDRAGPHGGTITRVDPDTGDSEVVLDGLVKPVGVALVGSHGGTLVATDAATERIWLVSLDEPGDPRRVLADDLGRPDSVCALGDDSVLVTTLDADAKRGAVVRLWLDGRRAKLVEGDFAPRGIATDGMRAFVSLRRASRVLVVPLAGMLAG